MTVMAGKFEIYTDKAGTFRFRLKAGNGEVVATLGQIWVSPDAMGVRRGSSDDGGNRHDGS